MKFSCNYDVILSNLLDVANIVDDSMLADALKNVILKFTKNSDNTVNCSFIGSNTSVLYRKHLKADEFECELDDSELSNGALYLQIRNKEVLNFLNAYKNLRRTYVDKVLLEYKLGDIKLKCVVIEKELAQDADGQMGFMDEGVSQSSAKEFRGQWMFDLIPVKTNMMAMINMELPSEGFSTVDGQVLSIYTTNLYPLLESDVTVYGQMIFDENVVLVFNKSFNTIMPNRLGNVLSGLTLSYKAVSFIDKIICLNEHIDICKTDTNIIFKTDVSETYIKYSTKLPNYQTVLELAKNKDSYIKIDRVLLKDVIRRFNLVQEPIKFTVDLDTKNLVLRNSKFEQVLDILEDVNMSEVAQHFDIPSSVVNKAILNNNDFDNSEVYIYCSPVENTKNIMIIFADDSKSWKSVLRTRVY